MRLRGEIVKITINIVTMAKAILDKNEGGIGVTDSDHTHRRIEFTKAEMKTIVERWVLKVVTEIASDAEWYATCSASNFYREFDEELSKFFLENEEALIARYNKD